MPDNRIDSLVLTDVESALISTFLCDNDAFFQFETREEFFTGDRRIVYGSIRKLLTTGMAADILTVFHDIGGTVPASKISKMMDGYGTSNIEHSIGQLSDSLKRRIMARAYQKALDLCFDGGAPDEIVSAANSEVTFDDDRGVACIEEVATKFYTQFEADAKAGIVPGLKTGIPSLDYATGGFRGKEWVVVAARPGVGKTSLAMNWVKHWGYMGKVGIVFSLEMGAEELVARMACDIGSIDSALIFKSRLRYDLNTVANVERDEHERAWKNLKSSITAIRQMPIFIDDTPQITISQIMTRARVIQARYGLDFIVIDYLQLLAGWNNEGQGAKGDITRMSKIMAKELDVPVITLCQMNRDIEKRIGSKFPQMSDLRDAGTIEQDADAILFPYLPYNHGLTDDPELALIFARKIRRGETGKIERIRWQGKYFRFSGDDTKRFSAN